MSTVPVKEVSIEDAAERRAQRPGPQVIPERDAILAGKQPMPESPRSDPPKDPMVLEAERRALQDAERVELARARDERRRERGLAHVAVLSIQVADRRVRLELDDAAAPELGRALLEFVDAAREWSRWSEELAERQHLVETKREYIVVEDGKRSVRIAPAGTEPFLTERRDRVAVPLAEAELRRWGGALGMALQNLVACGGRPYQPAVKLEAALVAEIRRQQEEETKS